MSYTTFEYSDITLSNSSLTVDGTIEISLKVKNVGDRTGKEVVQLYIADKESTLARPRKELKGFCKVELQPGQTKEVRFTVDREMLAYYDDRTAEWVAERGEFEAIVGASSSDIRLRANFTLK